MSNRDEKDYFVKGVILNDLTGKRFGKLTVLRAMPKTQRRTFYECQCDCGNIKVVRSDSLTSGRTISCGCEKKKQDRINLTKHHSHKQSGTRIYQEWQGMKARCYNINNKRYSRYGGRGISVCDEWREDFQAFYDWAMSNGYDDKLTIDRIDNNGNYKPSNCRWVDIKIQNRNRSSNIIVEYNRKKMCLTDAAQLANLPVKTLMSRNKRGDRGEYLFRPLEVEGKNAKHWVEYNGENIPLSRASKLSGIPRTTLFRRYNKGLRGANLFKK